MVDLRDAECEEALGPETQWENTRQVSNQAISNTNL